MKAILDNNLPVTIRERVLVLVPDADIVHLRDLGLQDQTDDVLRLRWANEPIARITRDEDFWANAPAKRCVIWVSCHNPKLSFLLDRVAPAIARSLKSLKPGMRLLVTEDFLSVV